MSDEQSNQPRKVKDLKARLGRTIAPSTPGAVMPPGVVLPTPPGAPVAAAPAAAAADGGVVPPPNLPAPALPPPPAGVGGGGLAAPIPGPKAVVEPPWVKQQREDEERRRVEDEKRRKRAAADPFAAAAAPAGPQAVRIVVDDSAIDAAESGKKGKNAATIGVIVVVALISILIGKFLGSAMAGRQAYNDGADAAENIYTQVQSGDRVLTQVKAELDKLVRAAGNANGNSPHVDYAAITALLAIQNPFSGEHFRETRYTVFDAATIDAMLTYYNRVLEVFDRTERLARLYNIRNPASKAQLDASFQAANDISRFPTGCVPALVGQAPQQRIMCNMVFVDVEHAAADGVPTRQRPTASATNRTLYSGAALGAENLDKTVILVNFAQSTDVMGSTLHLHDRFLRDVGELKTAIDEAIEARAAFRNELNRVRQLPRQFTF